MTDPADPTLILPLLLMVLPIVVVFLHDLHGCTRNCRQGRDCNCKKGKR